MTAPHPRVRAILAASAAALATATAVAAPSTTRYRLTDLGPALARNLNATGQVVGLDPDNRPATWRDGTWTPLAPVTDGGVVDGSTLHINDAGDVAGTELLGPPGDPVAHAVFWPAAGGAPVRVDHQKNVESTVGGLSHDGIVVGVESLAHSGGLRSHGYAWRHGPMRTLPKFPLGGRMTPLAINGHDEIGGTVLSGDALHAVQFSYGVWTDYGTVPGGSLTVSGINLRGEMCGWAAMTPGSLTEHAVVWRATGVVDLGTLGGSQSFAMALNHAGVVVGSVWTPTGAFAFVVPHQGAMQDLNTLVDGAPGWTLTSALAVNDAGVIVGQAVVGGEGRAVLLTPVAD